MEIEAKESAFERVHIPEGLHPAEFFELVNGPDGQYGPRVVAEFYVYHDKDKEPVKLGRFYGKKLTPKSKLWECMTALGVKLEAGKNLVSEELKGNPCQVLVKDYIHDDDGKARSGITEVLPPQDDTLDKIQSIKQKIGSPDEKQTVEVTSVGDMIEK